MKTEGKTIIVAPTNLRLRMAEVSHFSSRLLTDQTAETFSNRFRKFAFLTFGYLFSLLSSSNVLSFSFMVVFSLWASLASASTCCTLLLSFLYIENCSPRSTVTSTSTGEEQCFCRVCFDISKQGEWEHIDACFQESIMFWEL